MLSVLIKKDLLLEFRSKEIVVSMAAFGISVIVLYALGFNASSEEFLKFSPGLLWMMFLFISVLGLHRSFSIEKEFDAFGLLLSAPVSRSDIFLSKWISSFLFLLMSQIIVLPIFFLFLNVSIPKGWLLLILVFLIADLGITALGSLVSGIAMRVRMSEVILPILLFPLVTPLLISVVKCTHGLFNDLLFEEWKIWFQIMVTFVLVFGVTGYLIFDYVSEE